MALKLKVLKQKVPPPSRNNDDDDEDSDPGEGTSRGPAQVASRSEAATPQAEARTRHHVFNQSAVQGW